MQISKSWEISKSGKSLSPWKSLSPAKHQVLEIIMSGQLLASFYQRLVSPLWRLAPPLRHVSCSIPQGLAHRAHGTATRVGLRWQIPLVFGRRRFVQCAVTRFCPMCLGRRLLGVCGCVACLQRSLRYFACFQLRLPVLFVQRFFRYMPPLIHCRSLAAYPPLLRMLFSCVCPSFLSQRMSASLSRCW